jgi:hypothetical protein
VQAWALVWSSSTSASPSLTSTPQRVFSLPLHSARVACVRLQETPGGPHVLSCGYDGLFRAFSLRQKRVVSSFAECGCPLACLAAERGGGAVWLGSWVGKVFRLDLENKCVSSSFFVDEETESPVRALCLAQAPAPPKRSASKSNSGSGGKGTSPNNRNFNASLFPEIFEEDLSRDASEVVVVVTHGAGKLAAWDLTAADPLVSRAKVRRPALVIHRSHISSCPVMKARFPVLPDIVQVQ